MWSGLFTSSQPKLLISQQMKIGSKRNWLTIILRNFQSKLNWKKQSEISLEISKGKFDKLTIEMEHEKTWIGTALTKTSTILLKLLNLKYQKGFSKRLRWFKIQNSKLESWSEKLNLLIQLNDLSKNLFQYKIHKVNFLLLKQPHLTRIQDLVSVQGSERILERTRLSKSLLKALAIKKTTHAFPS